MEVVLNSYIARLVFGYLQEQNLDKVATTFCKYSPYLQEEYEVIKQGLKPICCNDVLLNIIKDYCTIKCKVKQTIEEFPITVQNVFQKQNLIGQITRLLKVANKAYVQVDELENCPIEICNNRNSVNSHNIRKRQRTDSSTSSDLEAKKNLYLPGYRPSLAKRGRFSGTYQLLQDAESADSDQTIDEDQETQSNEQYYENNIETNGNIENTNSFAMIPERILEHKEFQNKLVENINKALHTPTTIPNKINNYKSGCLTSQPILTAENQDTDNICEGQLIEDVIQNILNATERDPLFDEVVEEVVLSNVNYNNNKKNVSTTSNTLVQINQQEIAQESNILNQHELLQKQKNSNQMEIVDETNQSEILEDKICTETALVSKTPIVLDTPRSKNSIIFKPTITSNAAFVKTPINSNQISAGNVPVDSNYSVSKFIIMSSSESNSIFNQSTNLYNLQGFEDVTTSGDQLYIDYGNGQAVPFIISNDCVLVSNNELVPQQILAPQNSSSNNMASSTSNDFLNEAMLPDLHMNSSEVELNKNTSENGLFNFSTSILDKSMTLPIESRIPPDKETPSTNCIINISSARSLSTPRRKNSHVRVLSFSPMPKNVHNINQVNDVPTEINQKKENIIESVQILPNIEKGLPQISDISSKSLEISNNLLQNENSSSNSINTDQTSNLTVIQMNTSTSTSNTPRRKPEMRSCKRVFSTLNNDNILKKKNDESKNEIKKKTLPKTKNNKKKDELKKNNEEQNNSKDKVETKIKEVCKYEEEKLDAMQAWKDMRAKCANSNFDQHLREIAAKAPIVVCGQNNRKKRKKTRSLTKKKKKIVSSVNNEDTIENNLDEIKNNVIPKNVKSTTVRKPKSSDKTDIKVNLLNFKIKTPLKNKVYLNKNLKSTIKKKSKSKSDQNLPEDELENLKSTNDGNLKNKIIENKEDNSNTKEKDDISLQLTQELEFETHQKILEKEQEMRTTNIAMLLETPFKLDGCQFPITPRYIPPSATAINTPATKSLLNFSINKHIDIQTPAFAITPGSTMTPIEKETPKSGGCFGNILTDYSSGGSYYRPDESEDLCKQLDRELAEQMRKKRLMAVAKNSKTTSTQINMVKNINSSKHDSNMNIIGNVGDSTKDDQKKDIDVVECAVVLEKIKSFTEESPKIIPHYKFMDSLPELSESTTSPSSSSSSSTSSDSSSSESTSKSLPTKNTSEKIVYSDVDSSEDEDWEIVSNKLIETPVENSHLVSQDGQVRFPVRSWITPTKVTESSEKSSTSIKLILKNKEHKRDLEEKKQRIKAKLIEDSTKVTQAKLKTCKKRQQICELLNEKNEKQIESIYTKDDNVKLISQMDVLTALNLSAKKKPCTSNVQESNPTLLPDVDDNATSDVFSLLVQDESNESLKVRNAALALTTLSQKEQKKLTLQIEPQPLSKKLRGRPSKKKNLVKKQVKENILSKKISLYDVVTANSCKKTNKKDSPISNKNCTSNQNVMATKNLALLPPLEFKATELEQEQTPSLKIGEKENKNDKINNFDSDDEDSTEEDPYEICEICTSVKTSKNDFEFTYNGSDISQPKNDDVFSNLSKMAINLCLDGQRHQLKINDSIILFSQLPDLNLNENENFTLQNTTKINNKSRENMDIFTKINKDICFGLMTNSFEHTSIPDQLNTKYDEKIHGENNKQNDSKLKDVESEKTISTPVENCDSGNKTDTDIIDKVNQDLINTKNIRNEDIYAVLSHVHGNEGK